METDKWQTNPKEDRLCNICLEHVGNEIHYLFICNNAVVQNLQRKHIPNYF